MERAVWFDPHHGGESLQKLEISERLGGIRGWEQRLAYAFHETGLVS